MGRVERVESCHTVWLFDVEKRRYRRVPRGTSLDIPAAPADWEPYVALEVDDDSDEFVVRLNEEGTRLLRSWRHTEDCAQCQDAATEELSLDAIRDLDDR